jgi:isoaspartyl peptidase/L-asparaginase-like protein (Ntn-hydrolase superfamily)
MIILAIHGGCGTFNEQIEKSCSSALKSTIKKGGKQEEESQLVQAIMVFYKK